MSEKTTAAPSRAPKILGITGIIGIVILFFGAFGYGSGYAPPAEAAEPTVTVTASPEPEPSPTETAVSCEPQYVQVAVGNDNYNVDDEFKEKYAKATAEANNISDAQRDLLIEETARNAHSLAIWASAFGLYEDPNNWEPLVEGNCLSQEGMILHAQFEGALTAKGTKLEEDEAPANGYNSGVSDDGTFGVAESQGISGDRKAIKITLADGTVVWIMVRCGNVVYPEKPPIPEVPTDEKHPEDDPYPRGNAPTGGGPNADPGPGQYIAPEDMEKPPSTPRVNPDPPAPKPTPGSGSGSGSTPKPTPDSDPPPAPEPSAPPPSNPEDGCIVIPGIEDCS